MQEKFWGSVRFSKEEHSQDGTVGVCHWHPFGHSDKHPDLLTKEKCQVRTPDTT
jgi:hypothetical protein